MTKLDSWVRADEEGEGGVGGGVPHEELLVVHADDLAGEAGAGGGLHRGELPLEALVIGRHPSTLGYQASS